MTMTMRLFLLAVPLAAACRTQPREVQPPADSAAAQARAYQATISRDSLIYVAWNIPTLARDVMHQRGLNERYEVFLGLNPYYQRGWFDGDTIADVAVQITEKSSGKRGIAIVHGGDSTVHVLGAGTRFGNGGDDFTWLWIWRVEPRASRPEIVALGRELLKVEKPESAGGIIAWNGRAYTWTQAGD